MLVTSSEEFAHRGADLSSDLGQGSFVRRFEGKAKQHQRVLTSTSTMDTLDAYPIHTTVAPSSVCMSTKQALGKLGSAPRVCKDECERETMGDWRSAPMDRNRKEMSTMDGHQDLTVNTLEILGTLESLPSVCYDEVVRPLFEPVRLKHTFIDFDDALDPDNELPMRSKCLSDPARAEETSMESNLVEAKYGATLRQRAARLRETHQVMSPNVGAQQKRVDQSVISHDATKSQSCHSQVTRSVPSQQDELGRRDVTMASVPSCEDVFENLSVVIGQANVQRNSVSIAVTTLMVCNLPCKLSSEGLTQVVDELGFRGRYDLIYVPRGARNFMGYGFVNFKDPAGAALLAEVIGTHRFPGNPNKRAYCKVADRQGLQNTLRQIYRGNNYRRRAQLPVTN